MKSCFRILAGGVLVTAMLWACATAAVAGRLSFRNEYATNAWRATWTEMTFNGGFGTVGCPLTLEGSFHSNTFTKTASALIGYITEGRAGTCVGMGGTVLRENLPWHIRYEGFTGALPNISSVSLKIVGFEFKIREPTFGVTCLFRSTEASPLTEALNRETRGIVSSATLSGTISGTAPCGLTGTFGGTSASFGTPPPPPTTITLTLI